jgi:hypothetical protein
MGCYGIMEGEQGVITRSMPYKTGNPVASSVQTVMFSDTKREDLSGIPEYYQNLPKQQSRDSGGNSSTIRESTPYAVNTYIHYNKYITSHIALCQISTQHPPFLSPSHHIASQLSTAMTIALLTYITHSPTHHTAPHHITARLTHSTYTCNKHIHYTYITHTYITSHITLCHISTQHSPFLYLSLYLPLSPSLT